MSQPSEQTTRPAAFADFSATPAEHFKLYFYAAVLRVVGQVLEAHGSREAAFEQFPFLIGYNDELALHGLDGLSYQEALERWLRALGEWEETAAVHLPLRALREAAGLDHEAMTLLLCVGLIEEDARFGLLFAAMQGTPGLHRPNFGLLHSWWRRGHDDTEVRVNLRRLRELGLVQVVNPDAPRAEWALQPPALLWDALRGDAHEHLAPWARLRRPEQLPAREELILPEALRRPLEVIPALLAEGEVQALFVRGPQSNGRRTIVGAMARALGRGLLEITGLDTADDPRWPLVGPLATACRAVPAVVLNLGPGETLELPRLPGYVGPLGVVLGRQGGVSGPGAERALTLNVEMPDPEARRALWRHGFASHGATCDELDEVCERFRITSGNVRRASGLARSYSLLEGRAVVKTADVQQASRALNHQALDTLAVRVEADGDWTQLATNEETLRELLNLESRCRHRERLRGAVGAGFGSQLTHGVRALFSGPSGTGKTLAARLLASALQKDLYRLDLSTVVNKYIGETEKSLNRVFSRAEELDVILLLDEGDALLTQRTSVQTSNDRYANLETNYLLQRLETFEGILLVTTNAGDRIDGAFQRRMDTVVNFRPPDAAERARILHLHLPAAHDIASEVLRDVAVRCALTGGQIRNAVLHASLLALNEGGPVGSAQLRAAVQREYRKTGAVCPLRGT